MSTDNVIGICHDLSVCRKAADSVGCFAGNFAGNLTLTGLSTLSGRRLPRKTLFSHYFSNKTTSVAYNDVRSHQPYYLIY